VGRDPAPENVPNEGPRALEALVGLLADESSRVRAAAEAALGRAGVTPERLRALAEAIDDPARRTRARARVEALRLQSVEHELASLCTAGEPDLETGSFLLARLYYPELDAKHYSDALDGMADEVRDHLKTGPRRPRGESPVRAGACALRRFLHEERGFKGNLERYDDPENVFLNRVLDRRVGIPTSLSCLYLLLGRRLGVPLEGVNLPLHFLVRYSDDEGETFIDAFARGRFLTRGDCRDFLRGAGLEEKPEFLCRASDRQVLSRLVRCLVASFRSTGASSLAARFERCLAIVARSGEPLNAPVDRPAEPGRGEATR